jgi:hypothetical protein
MDGKRRSFSGSKLSTAKKLINRTLPALIEELTP